MSEHCFVEKEYKEYNCSKVDNLSMNIKSEPIEWDDLLKLTSDEISGELINIKTENVDELSFEDEQDNNSLKECEQEDPLSFTSNAPQVHDNIDAEVETNASNDTASIKQNDQNESQFVITKRNNKSTKSLPYRYLKGYSCQCTICNGIFASREEILKHLNESHKSYRPFECKVCGKKFISKYYVDLHMRIHSGSYVCPLCSRSFCHITNFTLHMRMHNGSGLYSCEVCGKIFYGKSGHTIHMQSHIKKTPYQCEVCGRRFTHSKSLLVYRQKYTGKKHYVCSYCGKSLSHKHKIHVKLHTGERPYKCKVCGKAFSKNDDFSRHTKSHGGIKSFKCSICRVYCATQASITGHINLHHNNLKSESKEPPPEKTLVKDSVIQILGTRALEPRSLYRIASHISGSGENIKELRQVSPINTRISTRVIEVISKDTPINISANSEKPSSNKINCILSKQNLSPGSGKNKTMNYQKYLKCQEQMLANQGLIVKGYSSSTSKDNQICSSNNDGTISSTNTTNVTTDINHSSSSSTTEIDNVKNTQLSISSPSPNVKKPQYLLLSQGTEGNTTKILLPLSMIEQNQGGKYKQPINLSTMIAPNTGAQGSCPLTLLPQTTGNQPLLLLSNGGKKMLLIPSQNFNKDINSPQKEENDFDKNTQVKKENDFDKNTQVKKESDDSLFAPEMTIKTETEALDDATSLDFQSTIKIEEEPNSYNEV